MDSIALTFLLVSQNLALPPGLLSAVCYVESGHKHQALVLNDKGTASFGVCQVKLATARLMGFNGSSEILQQPVVNTFYAGKYLKWQLGRYHKDLVKAVAAYNCGSVSGEVRNTEYVQKVMDAWVKESK